MLDILIIVFLIYLIYNCLGDMVFLYGNKLYNENKKEKAFKTYAFATEKLRVKPRTRAIYGALLLKNGYHDKAREVINLVIMDNPNPDVLYYAKSINALIKYKDGNMNEALEIMDDVIKNYKNSFNLGNAGSLYNINGDAKKALEFNREAYEYNDTDPLILDNLAESYILNEMYDEAGEVFEKLMNKSPAFPDAYFHYAKYLCQKGKYTEALEEINKAKEFTISYISPVSAEDIKQLEESIKKHQ